VTGEGKENGIQDSGFGHREGFIEKWKGDSPSPLILSLGVARKNKEGFS
jgi:hypothetical protein